jgi:hypothetical protein
VAGVASYLVLPSLIAVLGAWPRQSTLNPAWFTVGSTSKITVLADSSLASANRPASPVTRT